MTTTPKKRLLIINDANFLCTGYAKYGKELLSRLYATGKYEIAELGCYADLKKARQHIYPWKFYPNAVESTDERYDHYKQQKFNEYGAWRFERVCLDFKPDIVMSIMDPWMFAYQDSSPLREFYHWLIMPTVDSHPQKEEWLDLFSNADSILTYSQYGLDVLNNEGGPPLKKKLKGLGSCGINTEVFKRIPHKTLHKSRLGIPQDTLIVGTVMRNQVRKLFPELFIAFKAFIEKCYAEGKVHTAQNTYLYCHTSHPDAGWDIPLLLKNSGVSNRIMFTYVCEKCGTVECKLFGGERTVCGKCSQPSSLLPHTGNGVDDLQLASIINLFDVYVQYSVAEGLGMPQLEAGSCGVPVMSVDYSAMSSIVRGIGGTPIKVDRMFHDMNTHSMRALPDNNDLTNKLFEFLNKPESIRAGIGNNTMRLTHENFDWDKVALNWEKCIDEATLTKNQGKWDLEHRDIKVADFEECPKNINSQSFVDWCITRVANEPRYLNTRLAMTYVNELTYGGRIHGKDIKPLRRKDVYEEFRKRGINKQKTEEVRSGKEKMMPEDYLSVGRKS